MTYTDDNHINNMFLNLLKRTLCGMTYEDPSIPVAWRMVSEYDASRRINGRDWPLHAHTMIGLKRLENLQACIEQVIGDGIPGDLIECGVWRGGACIFMRGVLKVYRETTRTVWVADSFKGFPIPIRNDDYSLASQPDQAFLSVSQHEVVNNFYLYGLMDDQVQFIPGWFHKTLPGPVKQLAVLRLDSDLHSSTTASISRLYPLLSPGGYCIVDDWNVPMCKLAVEEYRDEHEIKEQIIDIDGHSVYWRKLAV